MYKIYLRLDFRFQIPDFKSHNDYISEIGKLKTK
jgi:hypothetical protein